jgi:cell pole-organizing protein PopZ
MNPSSPQHEPTMEEILASIRKIISEDSSEPPPPAAASEPTPAPAPAPAATEQDNDALELTDVVQEEPAAPQAVVAPEAAAPEAVAPPPPPESASPPQPTTPAENDVVFISHEEVSVSAPAQISDGNGIFSDKARKAIDDAFAGLDQLHEAPKPQATRTASMPPVEGNSVEAVFERAVRASIDPVLQQWMDSRQQNLLELVKPMIREWMDEHFPALLEGAVRDEVARVIKARGGR